MVYVGKVHDIFGNWLLDMIWAGEIEYVHGNHQLSLMSCSPGLNCTTSELTLNSDK